MRPHTFHLSFDFWNTVGKPNPEYAGERTRFLAERFEVDEATAKATYSVVKGQLDHLAETNCAHTGYYECLATLCLAFGMKPVRPHEAPAFRWSGPQNEFMRRLGNGMDELFARHPPTVEPALVNQLNRANSMWSLLPGPMVTLSIGSNTNFIRGHLITEHVLKDIPFAFKLFSNETD